MSAEEEQMVDKKGFQSYSHGSFRKTTSEVKMKEGSSRLLLKQVEEEMNSQQLQALVVYEMVSTLCSGISQVEAVSGHAKFTLALDGLDIFQTLTQSPKFKDLIDEVERERESKGLSLKKKSAEV